MHHSSSWPSPARRLLRAPAVLALLALLALVLGTATTLPAGAQEASSDGGPNPVVLENALPGTDQWRIGRAGDDRSKQVQGYASASSVDKGDELTLFVTVNPAQQYTTDIYRLGYYQGLGGRLVMQLGAKDGTPQAACPVDAATGATACAWDPQAGHAMTVPTPGRAASTSRS